VTREPDPHSTAHSTAHPAAHPAARIGQSWRSEHERGIERRLVALMGARLGLALVSLCITLGLEAAGEAFSTAEWRGFYATIAFAFTATIVYGVVLNRVIRPARFAALNVVTDVAIVTALVHFSGGNDSVFPFLYLLVAAYGAFLFDFRGALGTALLAQGAYGTVLLAAHRGWIPNLAIGPPEPAAVLLTNWVVTSGAVAIVAILASLLTAELRRTGAALDQRTMDLLRLENLHQRTVESLMSGLLTTDRQFRITSFNPEAERITGSSAAEAIGRKVDEIVPEIGSLGIAALEAGAMKNLRTRISYRNGAGQDLHLGIAVYILKDATSAPDGFVMIFQDVTSVVAMEAELRRSERLAAVGELSASIAHEVRNPLAAISGSMQILRSQLGAQEGGGEARRLMDIALRETDRLNRLITDFLRYARPGPAVLEVVDLASAIEDVMKMFESVSPRDLEVEVRVEPGLGVAADASQLRQVLWNLVLNAAESMENGGSLRVTAARWLDGAPQGAANVGRNVANEREKPAWVEIAIADRGCGVPEEALERVFDPFFTTKDHGSGLGLPAVHRIVEEHGGSVKLESRVGQGTTVRVRFPQAEVDS
jgi:two-component system sensor histidine kinase PilS (NtrC family)